MLTLEEIGGKIKEFGDKAVSGLDAVTKGLDALKADVTSRFDRNEKGAQEMAKRIDDLSSKLRERPAGETQRDTAGEVDLTKFSVVKALLAADAGRKGVADPWGKFNAGYERDVNAQLRKDAANAKMPEIADDSILVPASLTARKKAMTFMDETSGGFLANTQHLPGVIPPLRPNNVSFQIPITQYNGLTGVPAKIPRQSSEATGYWVPENTAVTASNPSVEQLAFYPKKVGAMTQLTRDLMLYSPGTAEAVARNSLAFVLEKTEDVAFWEGSGVSGQPKGLDTWAGNTKSFSGATDITTWTTLDQMIMENEADNGPTDGAVWVMHPRVWHKLCQIQLPQAVISSTAQVGVPVLTNGNYAMGIPKMLKGYPVYLTTNITASTTSIIKFFVPSETIRARWGAMELRVTDQGTTLQTSDLMQITAWDRVDHGVVHANSVCTGTAFTY